MKPISKLCWLLLILVAGIALAGYFGPWVPHRAAGLVIIGLDLAEYVKFLPPTGTNPVAFPREVFYLPLLSGSLAASLIASRSSLPRWLRMLLALAAIPLALAMLPPAWSKTTFQSGEYRPQVVAMIICLALAPGALLTRHLPDRVLLALLAVLGLAAAIFPAWRFTQIHPAIVELYRRPLPFGWGFYACVIGNSLQVILAIGATLQRGRASRS